MQILLYYHNVLIHLMILNTLEIIQKIQIIKIVLLLFFYKISDKYPNKYLFLVLFQNVINLQIINTYCKIDRKINLYDIILIVKYILNNRLNHY